MKPEILPKPADNAEAKEQFEIEMEEQIEEIEAKYGTLICREMSQPFGDFDSKPRKKNCMEITAYCAALAVKYAEM